MHRRVLERRRLMREAAAETERALPDLTLIGPARGAELRALVYGK
jgi:hypothetical protein